LGEASQRPKGRPSEDLGRNEVRRRESRGTKGGRKWGGEKKHTFSLRRRELAADIRLKEPNRWKRRPGEGTSRRGKKGLAKTDIKESWDCQSRQKLTKNGCRKCLEGGKKEGGKKNKKNCKGQLGVRWRGSGVKDEGV